VNKNFRMEMKNLSDPKPVLSRGRSRTSEPASDAAQPLRPGAPARGETSAAAGGPETRRIGRSSFHARYRTRGWKRLTATPYPLLGVLALCSELLFAGDAANVVAKPDRPLSYFNDVDPKVPWSIHVVRIERSHPELRFCTTLGDGQVLGMSTVPEQLKSLPSELGQPVAAINGDFFEKSKDYAGCPRDLQIREGEVVSDPAGHSCFWIDAQGNPRMTNVFSRFRVVWPNGKATPAGLNRQRTNNAVMLYTSVIGKSTRTSGGIEYVLERWGENPWLPLRAGETYQARVRAVLAAGNSALERDTLVVSVPPNLVAALPALPPGATLKVVTETIPDLAGAEFAIGGGPALVQEGKLMEWGNWVLIRHPRSAVGWNKTHFFLVEVDGRQIDLSLGMTFPELAQYMLKLGCDHALNFDGGGSATLWALGSVRNSPSEGQERPAPNALVVVKKNSKPQPK